MVRIIGDKLNFLMRLTQTKNNVLGKAISFDPSYISRIRTGARGVPKHREFIFPAASFFVEAVKTEAQKKILAETICPDRNWPEDADTAVGLVAKWLMEDIASTMASGKYVEDPAHFRFSERISDVSQKNGQEFFFGNAGKRECVIRFLTDLDALNEPVKLLLHSEEDMQWLYENPGFARNWSILLKSILQKGGRIVIVHTVRRTLNEMLEAIAKWSPLYASGLIESYYCPRLRDNIFKHTLFIASGKAAIFSQTATKNGKSRLNLLVHDLRAVNALEKEFYDFLAICRPLFSIYNSSNFAQIAPVLSRFPRAQSRLLQFHDTPSWLSMPEETAKSLSLHPGCELFYDNLRSYSELLFMQEGKQGTPVTDFIFLPGIRTVIDGLVPVPLADVFGLPMLFYTGEEFRQHLTAALHRFKTSQEYRIVLLAQDNTPSFSVNLPLRPFSVVASETAGVILYRSSAPSMLFYTLEQDMTLSFCEYLEQFEKGSDSRELTIEKLQRYLDELEEALQQDRRTDKD